MSTPDQPSTPPLTRRQLRELRNTASTPIITPEQAQADAEMSDAAAEEAAEAAAAHEAEVAPERTPIALDDLSDLDPDAQPVTRRQARLLEKLRTGTLDVVPADTGEVESTEPEEELEPAAATEDAGDAEEAEGHPADAGESEVDEPVEEPVAADEPADGEAVDDAVEQVEEEPQGSDSEPGLETETPAHDDAPETGTGSPEGEEPVEAQVDTDAEDSVESEPDGAQQERSAADEEEKEPARVVAPDLGAQLLEDGAAHVDLPPSFDHLLTRGGSGSASAPNALILSQTPDTGSLSVPILGTGELIITGSYQLPDTFGSTGAAPGVSDGKDADAALMDGELPAASSPTPIAASAAISTIKSADEIIRPPAPEKGSRLMMTLAICAGALGLAIATVLVLILVNGNF